MNRILILLVVLMLMSSSAQAQRPGRGMGGSGTVTGSVIDESTGKGMEYTNVALYSLKTDEVVTGAITKKDGKFIIEKVPFGVYYAQIKYIGFLAKKIDDIKVTPRTTEIDLGEIKLVAASLELDGVEVTADKAAIEYKIDKKIINVAQHYTAASGNAIDVLENVPSVSVDIQGNVSLRGSSGFMVLVDGKPSVLDANDALRQIPASTIENIEIITNPSAKYDPEGTSGIVNVITKKIKMEGTSGMLNLNAGLDDKYGAEFLYNYKNDNYSVFLGGDYNKRYNPSTSKSENITTNAGVKSYINSEGDNSFQRVMYGLRTGFEYNFSDNDVISIQARYGNRSMKMASLLDYTEFIDNNGGPKEFFSSDSWSRGGDYYSLTSDYKHLFETKGHELSAQIDYSDRYGDEESINTLYLPNGILDEAKKSTEKGPSQRMRFRIDYAYPLSKTDKLEFGTENNISKSEDLVKAYSMDTTSTNTLQFIQDNTNTTNYNRNIYAVYGIYSGELGDFGYQGGLRTEYTDRAVSVKDSTNDYVIDRWDLFPTLHFSYKFSEVRQIMASYTKRIERPRGYFLEPFETWSDAYNVRRGNPDLKPEYIDSYEIAFQNYFGKNFVSAELFYRHTYNKIERIKSVYSENIILNSFENIGNDYALGADLMFNWDILPIWNANIIGSAFQYEIDSRSGSVVIQRKSTNWSAKLNNTLKLESKTNIQFNLSYNSPSVSTQGTREGFLMAHAAVRQDFMGDMFSLTLQARDIFSTAKDEFTSEGTDFYIYSYSKRKSPELMLTFTYNFNHYKPKRSGNDRGDSGGDDFE